MDCGYRVHNSAIFRRQNYNPAVHCGYGVHHSAIFRRQNYNPAMDCGYRVHHSAIFRRRNYNPAMDCGEMELFVHGFPSDVAALRFEWAWQHPNSSRHLLLAAPARRRGEQPISFALRVLPRLLRAPPWCRLPLRIRWLRPPGHAPELAPPPHVTQEEGAGPPRLKRKKGRGQKPEEGGGGCGLCEEEQATPLLRCPHPQCKMAAHPPCLARLFLAPEPQQLLPIGGACPG
uniref:structure-specific endonuclease subunit SLX1-like n=1 Tax=Lonchura striata TaxID=40157 RepID=UPI0012938DC6|nr:structure-specific endonuclease subunit SLX1-like [Lonchura striata domestica]